MPTSPFLSAFFSDNYENRSDKIFVLPDTISEQFKVAIFIIALYKEKGSQQTNHIFRELIIG